MHNNEKSTCFSGPRTERLPQTKEDLIRLENAVYNTVDRLICEGVDTFLFGACYGFDLLCAEQVLLRRRIPKLNDPLKINLIAVVPFEKQAVKWKTSNCALYFHILAQCNDVIVLRAHYCKGCYFARNQWMIERGTRLVCYDDGTSPGTRDTVRRAKKTGLEIINLYP